MKGKILISFSYRLKKKLKRQSTMPSWRLSLGIGEGVGLLSQALSTTPWAPLTRKSQIPLIALIQGMMKGKRTKKKRMRRR